LSAKGLLAMKSGEDMGGTTWRRSKCMQKEEPSKRWREGGREGGREGEKRRMRQS